MEVEGDALGARAVRRQQRLVIAGLLICTRSTTWAPAPLPQDPPQTPANTLAILAPCRQASPIIFSTA